MANLLLARLSSRRREIAVRVALGAGRWELARPILAESLLLSVAGGGLGLLVAVGGLRLLTTLPEGGLPRMEAVTLDGGVLLFTTVVSILVAIAFGLRPALQASRSHLRENLAESTGATGSFAARRTLSSLVVVEVVADVRNQGLDSEPKKQVYLPLRQNPVPAMALVARTERDPMAFAATLQREIWAVDAAQPIYDLSTMDQILARAVFLPRLSTTLLAIFAGATLLLEALGIYGVLSYSVTQRTREIGLRMALGATARETVGLGVRNSMLLIVAGIGVGLLAAAVLARSMAGILYGVSTFDLTAFVVAGLVLATTGLSASLIPARRAVRIDPMVALREQ